VTSLTRRDPVADYLLTPQNAALILIDYQPVQVNSVMSMDRRELVDNVVRVARTAQAYELPIVLSTVNVTTGINLPMIDELRALNLGVEPIDRTSINAWEDADFLSAVTATKRKVLVVAALWTEVCLVFPALDALHDGYEVYAVTDAVGGTSVTAHEAGLARIAQAGARMTSWVQLICELQRDWIRTATVPEFKEILFGHMHETAGG
jgi:nicotinamidase-related amidase